MWRQHTIAAKPDFDVQDSRLSSDVYSHYPGQLSHRAVLDVGLKCPHSCAFCYYSYLDNSSDQFRGMRLAKFRSLEDCKQILLGLQRNGFVNFDITGGEPSLHPNIVELTHYAHRDLGLKGRLITLGQYLLRKLPSCSQGKLIEELLDAGLTNFLLSVHAVDEQLFQKITGESWDRIRAAMCYLDDRDFHYTSTTTVFNWNYEHLPDIALELLKHKVYMHNFVVMNAYYHWAKDDKAFGVQAKYAEVFPYLSAAIDVLESHQIAVNVRYAPLCALRGYEKNLVGGVGVRYDPYEWMNKAGHLGGDPEFCASPLKIHESGVDAGWVYREASNLEGQVIARRARKVFPSICRSCTARTACDGVDAQYLQHHGSDELRPYRESNLYGPVPLARRRYMPAFQVKMSQWADMKSVVHKCFVRAGSVSDEARSIGLVIVGGRSLDLTAQTLRPRVVRACQSTSESLKAMSSDCETWIRVAPDVVDVPMDLIETILREFTMQPNTAIMYADSQGIDGEQTVFYQSANQWMFLCGLNKRALLPVIAFRHDAIARLQATSWCDPMYSDWNLLLAATVTRLKVRHLQRPLAIISRPTHSSPAAAGTGGKP